MRFEFHPEALAEYEEAAHYYAWQQPGLDVNFILCIEHAIELILEDPFRWHLLDEDIRRCLTRVFPYGILYTIERDFVLIVAVAHCSRLDIGRTESRSRVNERAVILDTLVRRPVTQSERARPGFQGAVAQVILPPGRRARRRR